jgi:hypothetical protein
MVGHKMLNTADPGERWPSMMAATAYPAIAPTATAGKPAPIGFQASEAVSRRLARTESTIEVIRQAPAIAVHKSAGMTRRGVGESMGNFLISCPGRD